MASSAPVDLGPTIGAAARSWNLDPALLRAVQAQESGGAVDPLSAVSPAGAIGPMQLMPDTAQGLGVTDPRDPVQNIYGGAKYLSQMLDRYGKPELALAAYNAGPGRVDGYLSGMGALPAETQAYVPGVTAHYQRITSQRASDAANSQAFDQTMARLRAQAGAGQGGAAPDSDAAFLARTGAAGATGAGQPESDDAFLARTTGATQGQSDDDFLKATGAAQAAVQPATAAPVAVALGQPDPVGQPGTAWGSIAAGATQALRDVSEPVARLGGWIDQHIPGSAALDQATGLDPNAITGAMDADRSAYEQRFAGNRLAGAVRLGGDVGLTLPVMAAGGAALGAGADALAAGAGAVSPGLGAAVRLGADFLGGTAGVQGAPAANLLTRGVSLGVNGALQGAAASVLTSGQSDESVGQQALKGAEAGALLGPAAHALAGGVSGAYNALAGTGGGATPEIAGLAQLARDTYGIPITAPQLSENSLVRIANDQSSKLPFSGAGPAREAQQTAFNRAVGNTFGEPADRITPDVMTRAANRIGTVFNQVAGRTTIQADQQFLGDLGRIQAEIGQTLPATEQAPINAQMTNLLEVAAGNNGAISGDSYQALTRAGAPLARAMKSADPNVAYYAGQVRDALDDAFQRSASPADQAALGQARGQYRAMRTVEDLVEKSPDGNISGPALLGQVRNASSRFDPATGGMAYTGGGPLGDLARIGQQFMKAQPNSGTPDRLLINALGSGAGVAGYFNPHTLVALPASLAANRLAGAYLRSGAFADRLIASSLTPGQNALVPALAGGVAPYAAPVGAIGWNALTGAP